MMHYQATRGLAALIGAVLGLTWGYYRTRSWFWFMRGRGFWEYLGALAAMVVGLPMISVVSVVIALGFLDLYVRFKWLGLLAALAFVVLFVYFDQRLRMAAWNRRAEQFLLAAQQGDVTTAQTLLERGVHVDAYRHSGDAQSGTALMQAATAGHAGLVELLLEWGADPTRTNDLGQTPLELAERGNHTAAAGVLSLHASAASSTPPGPISTA